MDMPDETRIRERAYRIWNEEGRPDGREHVHWDMARRQIEAEDGTGPQARSGAGPQTGAMDPTTPAEGPVARDPDLDRLG
ncbi:DUF2934 domain-containing protein [Prosthecomicrobium sp. N25]|uniref:DUF2934 domain-containing protein n=1 Tax=Prosthecomicrobium sp. N25 TaxID=3129254 RepID=UPI00307776F5